VNARTGGVKEIGEEILLITWDNALLRKYWEDEVSEEDDRN
jgi:hypothetical protein